MKGLPPARAGVVLVAENMALAGENIITPVRIMEHTTAAADWGEPAMAHFHIVGTQTAQVQRIHELNDS